MQYRISFLAAILIATSMLPASAGLKDYVAKEDSSYTWAIDKEVPFQNNTVYVVRMTSQTWQGIAWSHWLTLICPSDLKHADKAMLLVSGGSSRDTGPRINSGEAMVMAAIANQTKSLVAILEQVPNQPLFDGKSEDEIISYTYEKYLLGEGDDWPLLLPMAKSAVRAMDTIQAVAKDKLDADVDGFFVLGGSKRGWTTWLTAVADPRVVGIAPAVIDVLNMDEQMKHQLAAYGKYSEQIADYTSRDIQFQMDTEAGQKLLSIVDPFAYREELTLPKLVVVGTNDPYWTVDSASLYFPELAGEKHLRYCPNTGHDVDEGGLKTISAFYNSLLEGDARPVYDWNIGDDGVISLTWEDDAARPVLWSAWSDDRDFRDETWVATQMTPSNRQFEVKMDPPKSGWLAYYVELVVPSEVGQYGLCTQMVVLPDTLPFADKALATE